MTEDKKNLNENISDTDVNNKQVANSAVSSVKYGVKNNNVENIASTTTDDKELNSINTSDMNTEKTIGQIISIKRKNANLKLDDISNLLKIKAKYLEAIENDAFSVLPGDTYTIGFIKSYGSFLGLNPDEIVSKYKKQIKLVSDVERDEDLESVPLKSASNFGNYLIVFAIVGGITFVIFSGVKVLVSSMSKKKTSEQVVVESIDPKPAEKNELQEITENIPLSNESKTLPSRNTDESKNITMLPFNTTAVDTNKLKLETDAYREKNTIALGVENDNIPLENLSDSNKNVPAVQNQNTSVTDITRNSKEYGRENKSSARVFIKASGTSWVKLKQNGVYVYSETDGDIGYGQTVFEGTLNHGDIYFLPSNPDLYLTVGDSKNIDIYLDGERLRPLSNSEGVSRLNIEMSPEKLKGSR